MARRLLITELAMANVVLGGLLCGSGCIIPTPLQQEPAPVNTPPVFVSATPAFGFPVQHKVLNDPFEWDIVVDDYDGEDETLTARLFVLEDDQKLHYTNFATSVDRPLTPDLKNPQRRYGTFATHDYCHEFSGLEPTPPPTPFTLGVFVIVADRPFSQTDPTLSSGGLTDENHWELTCVQ
jgi:hypothetical protein